MVLHLPHQMKEFHQDDPWQQAHPTNIEQKIMMSLLTNKIHRDQERILEVNNLDQVCRE